MQQRGAIGGAGQPQIAQAQLSDTVEEALEEVGEAISRGCPAQFENCNVNPADPIPSDWCALFQGETTRAFCYEFGLG